MLDLTDRKELLNDLAGSEKKKKIVFEGETYMLKFPDPIRGNRSDMPYINNQYSEYIGRHVAKSLGLKVQDTFLATYVDGDKTKVCVACRDFSNDGLKLYKIIDRCVFYQDIPDLDIPDLKRAVVRVGSNFDPAAIWHILDDISTLSKEHKEACLRSMQIRYDHFIKGLVTEDEYERLRYRKKLVKIYEKDARSSKYHWIDDSISIDFNLPERLQSIISRIERADEEKDDMTYMEWCDLLENVSKDFVLDDALTKDQRERLLRRYN